MTIQETYQKIIPLLDRNFIYTPQLEARILIFYVLQIDEKDFILLKDKKEVDESDFNKLLKLIEKRLSGESIASIIKSKYFYDLEFFVDDTVLIPRPETELIIDIVLKKFDKNNKLKIVDIGCGSGNIAVTLAKHLDRSTVDVIDINPKAVEITKINAERNNISPEKIKLINSDFFEYSTKQKYDIILSNPPYIKRADVNELIMQKIISDPRNALDGGISGLDFYYRLNEFALTNLNTDGWMIVEHGSGQREEILNILNKKKFSIEVYEDLAGIDRVIAACYKG